jgi:hypothetical protein
MPKADRLLMVCEVGAIAVIFAFINLIFSG